MYSVRNTEYRHLHLCNRTSRTFFCYTTLRASIKVQPRCVLYDATFSSIVNAAAMQGKTVAPSPPLFSPPPSSHGVVRNPY